MAARIRLARGGRKKVARYRIVVTDSRSPRDGRFIETLGHYNPQAQPKEFSIKVDRMGYWLKQGATVTDTVQGLLREDRFAEKYEAVDKGLSLDSVAIERRPERKRKPKQKAKKES